MKSITVQELNQLLPTLGENDIIVDVRSPGEFEEERITGSVNMPLNSIVGQKEDLKNYDTVYVVCYSGSRSYLAVTQLKIHGLKNALNVKGGISQWAYSKFPLV